VDFGLLEEAGFVEACDAEGVDELAEGECTGTLPPEVGSRFT